MEALVQILAVVASPIIALLVNTVVTEHKEKKRRKQQLFQSLWLTRGHLGTAGRLSYEHVRALNLIELEFYKNEMDELYADESSTRVVEAWRAYRAQLYGNSTSPESFDVRDNLLVDLLYEMSRAVGYSFERQHIIQAYAPQGYADADAESQIVRGSVLELLRGQRALHISTEPPTPPTVELSAGAPRQSPLEPATPPALRAGTEMAR